MRVFYRHARCGEELDFTPIAAMSGWDALTEEIIDLVDQDRPRVGVVVRNRQVYIRPGKPMEYRAEVAILSVAHLRRGKSWAEVDKGWSGLPALLGDNLPC